MDRVWSDNNNSIQEGGPPPTTSTSNGRNTIFQVFNNHSVGYPSSFTVALHGIKCAESYVQAVREEAKAAGDTCARVTFIGSVCGAKYGMTNLLSGEFDGLSKPVGMAWTPSPKIG